MVWKKPLCWHMWPLLGFNFVGQHWGSIIRGRHGNQWIEEQLRYRIYGCTDIRMYVYTDVSMRWIYLYDQKIGRTYGRSQALINHQLSLWRHSFHGNFFIFAFHRFFLVYPGFSIGSWVLSWCLMIINVTLICTFFCNFISFHYQQLELFVSKLKVWDCKEHSVSPNNRRGDQL